MSDLDPVVPPGTRIGPELRLGCKLRAPDHHQGVRASLSRTASLQLPSGCDQRRAFDLILQQGRAGTCVANSAAGGTQQRMKMQGLGDWTPARMPLYHDALIKDRSFPVDEGTFPETVLGIMGTDGFAPESLAPYRDTQAAIEKAPDPAYRAAAARARVVDWGPVYRDRDSLKLELLTGHSVIVSMLLRKSFERVGSDGIVPVPHGSEEEIGGHEMRIVGFTPEGAIVANSWGRGWGRKGYCLIPWVLLEDPYTTRALHAIRTIQLLP